MHDDHDEDAQDHLDIVLALASAFLLRSVSTASMSSGLSISTLGTWMESFMIGLQEWRSLHDLTWMSLFSILRTACDDHGGTIG